MSNLTPIDFTQLIHRDGDRLFVTSLEVSNRFGKRHDNIMQAIKNLDCSDQYRLLNFKETVYNRPNPSGGAPIQTKMYEMTKDGLVFLVMGFTGKQAAAWKERYIDAFNWMYDKLHAQPAVADDSAVRLELIATQREALRAKEELLRTKRNELWRLQGKLKKAREEAEYEAKWRERALWCKEPMGLKEFEEVKCFVAQGLTWSQISRDWSYRSASALSSQYRKFAPHYQQRHSF